MIARPVWKTLIQPEALAETMQARRTRPAEFLGRLVVFDCRFVLHDPDAGEHSWRESHLPGARYAHLNRDLSDLNSGQPHLPGSGRHPWPSTADFIAWLGRNGVDRTTQVIAYDGGDGAYAARLWCLLHAIGHPHVAVLDGGWARWMGLGLPIDHGSSAMNSEAMRAAEFEPVQYQPAFSPGPIDRYEFDRSRLLDATQVQSRLEAGDLLIDARAAERFRGEAEPIDRIAGHVPGALNRPYAMNLLDGRFKSAEALRAEFSTLLAGRDPTHAMVMCGSGVTACHHLLAMEHAGLGGAMLFTGSWSGWIEDPQRPVAMGGAASGG
jgi:thiosulfate/3-mercaptopyruvate sulfurtransferase